MGIHWTDDDEAFARGHAESGREADVRRAREAGRQDVLTWLREGTQRVTLEAWLAEIDAPKG